MVEGEEKEGETIEAQAAVIRAHTLIHSLTHSLTAQAKLPASKSNRPGHPSHSCLLACLHKGFRTAARTTARQLSDSARAKSVSQSERWLATGKVSVCVLCTCFNCPVPAQTAELMLLKNCH